MNARAVLLGLLSFAGPVVAPLAAQLIHVSATLNDPHLIFHANHASTPWDHGVGFVTQLDIYYQAHAPIGALDPTKNFWRARVEAPGIGVFNLARPFQSVEASDQTLRFDYLRSELGAFERFEVSLYFESSIALDQGLPLPPLPALGSTEFTHSTFLLDATDSLFPVADLAEVVGIGDIQAIETSIVPVPESSTYGIGAAMLMAVAIGLRRRGAPLSRA